MRHGFLFRHSHACLYVPFYRKYMMPILLNSKVTCKHFFFSLVIKYGYYYEYKIIVHCTFWMLFSSRRGILVFPHFIKEFVLKCSWMCERDNRYNSWRLLNDMDMAYNNQSNAIKCSPFDSAIWFIWPWT